MASIRTIDAGATHADGVQLGATGEKIGLAGATPVVRPVGANQAALTDNTGGSVSNATLADGFTQGAALTDNTTGAAGTTLAAGVGVETLVFQFDLADIADGDLITDWVVGYKFKVLESFFFATEPVTTAAKATTLSLDIGATAITNSEIALTSANCTPAGVKVDNAGALSANTGASTDTLTVKAASTTAFAEGKGVLIIRIQNMDTADAIASLSARANEARTDGTTQNDNDAKIAELVNALRQAGIDIGAWSGAA